MVHSDIQTVKTADFEMEYFQFGTGNQAFVMIPGVSMKSVMLSADAIADAYEAYGDYYTVYVFDRKKDIGKIPAEMYSVWEMAEDTAAAMKEIQIEDAVIFGASQGGMIAQCIAIEHPELVHQLYLGSTLSRQNEVSIATFDLWTELAQGDDVEALNHAINTKVYSKEYYDTYKDIFASMEKDGTKEEMNRFHVLAQACRDFECYDQLNKIQCPVYVVGSKADEVLGVLGSEEIAEELQCSLYTYDGYSHAVYDEAPDYRDRMLKSLGVIEE